MGRAKIKAPKTLLLPCQAKWVQDTSRLKICEKSRQIGFTWCSAYADTRTMSREDNALDLWITSRDEEQAKLYIQDCLGWCDLFKVAAQYSERRLINREASFALEFANGKTVHSLSSNPDAQAGKRGHRRADEFALNKDNRRLYAIMYPGITWGGSLWLWSTHRGSANFFNSLIAEIRENGNPKGWSHHKITLQNALDEGLLDKLQSKWPQDDPRQEYDEQDYYDATRRECPDEETFAEEYMCVPSDDQSAYISYDLIDQCSYTGNIAWEIPLEPGNEYYLGMDIGRTKDLTVIYIVEKVGEMRYTRRIIELANTPFSEQERILYSYLALPYVRRACIDASGIGRQLAEQARQRFGSKVEEVVFTSGVKEDLATTTRRIMEDAHLRLPAHPALVADLRSIRKETTSAGNVRYVGERTVNGHADRFWALALSLMAAKSYRTIFVPQPIYTGGNTGRYGGSTRSSGLWTPRSAA